MADFSITSAKPATSGYEEVGVFTAAAAISVGDAVYAASSTTVGKAEITTSATTANMIGIAMGDAVQDGRVIVGKGKITVNSVGTPADPIVLLSDGAGQFRPYGDIGASERLVIAGVWTAATEIWVLPARITGITTPAS